MSIEEQTADVYRPSTIKRHRRTRAAFAQLDQQIIDALHADHPQSVRHVFCLMTDPRLPEPVEKSDRGYRQVQDRCLKLRRAGHVPYDWIADASRYGFLINTFADASDFLMRTRGLYRADLWRDAGVRCEVWAESRSIASVLLDDCQELAVSLYPCGGFASVSFAYEAAEYHNQRDDDRPLIILFVGDYDPAGVLIDRSLECELRRHFDPSIEMFFRRIAINEEQFELHGLPTKARKAKDRRSLHVAATVEAEAMPAHVLRGLLRDEIEALLPEHALMVAKEAEQSEREHIARMARLMGGDDDDEIEES